MVQVAINWLARFVELPNSVLLLGVQIPPFVLLATDYLFLQVMLKSNHLFSRLIVPF